MVSITPDEDPEEAGAYAKEIKATFPVVRDLKYAIHGKYGVQPIPANVVVNRKGKVIASIEGADLKALEAAVAKAVGK